MDLKLVEGIFGEAFECFHIEQIYLGISGRTKSFYLKYLWPLLKVALPKKLSEIFQRQKQTRVCCVCEITSENLKHIFLYAAMIHIGKNVIYE